MSQVKLALAQITGHTLDPERNREMTLSIVRGAAAEGAKLVILPELIIPGYVAVLSGSLEEKLPGWKITVGPREANQLPTFLKARA